MGFETTTIRASTFARQTTEPGAPSDGFLWVNPTGGNSGNNTERYYWNEGADTWELESAVGPDTPLYPAPGAQWRDTGNSVAKQNTDGTDSGWEPMGVTSHPDLSGITADDHHTRPTVTQSTDDTDPMYQVLGAASTDNSLDTGRMYIVSDRVEVDNFRESGFSDPQGYTYSINFTDGTSRSDSVSSAPEGSTTIVETFSDRIIDNITVTADYSSVSDSEIGPVRVRPITIADHIHQI